MTIQFSEFAIAGRINQLAKRLCNMTETLDKPTTATQARPVTTEQDEPQFGKGRYSAEMERLYNQAQELLGFTPTQAEKFARQAGADAGSALKNSVASIRVSKANADGKATISDAAKLKGVTLTNSLAIVRAIQWIGEAEKNFVSYGKTKWTLSAMNENLAKYVAGL